MKKLLVLLIILMTFVTGCAVEQPDTPQETLEIEKDIDIPPGVHGDENVTFQEELLPENEPEEEPEPEVDHTEYQQTPRVDPTTPLSFKLTMPKLTIDCEGEVCLDYFAAYAMAARYYNKGIDLAAAAGYGMIGSDAKMWHNEDIDNNVGETMMIIASDNYQFSYLVSSEIGGKISPAKYDLKFEDDAEAVIYSNNEADALEKLKEAVSSRLPVIVYLDVAYLQTEFAMRSNFWSDYPETNEGHFMVVTGYDQEYIYLHDPNDINGKNLPATTSQFMLAWETTKFLDKDSGPFWMFQLKNNAERKVEEESLIASNNEASAEAIDNMKDFALKGMKSDETCHNLAVLSKTRSLYSDFLDRYEYGMAASMYDDSAEFLRYACDDGIRDGLTSAATKESNAQSSI